MEQAMQEARIAGYEVVGFDEIFGVWIQDEHGCHPLIDEKR